MQGTKKESIFITVSANFLLAVVGAATGILVARLLGPGGRGELAAITLWPGTLLTMGGLGIPNTIAYFVARQPQQIGKIYANALALAVIQCLVLVIVGLVVIPIALRGEFAHVIPLGLVFLASIPLSLYAGIHMGILQGLLRMKQHSLLRVIPTGIYMLGLLLLFVHGKDNLRLLVGLLLLPLFVACFLGLWFIRDTIRGDLSPDRGFLKTLLGYGLKTQLANSTQSLNLRLDQLIMSAFLSPQNLGYYAVAVTLSRAINPLSSAVGIVTLSDVASQEGNEHGGRVVVTLRITFVILVLLAVMLIMLMPWLLPLLLGREFMPASIPAQVLVVGSIFLGMNDVLAGGLRGMNRPGLPALAELCSLGMTALLLYFLLPRYGIMGAAVASVAAYATTFGIMAAGLAKHSRLCLRTFFPTTSDFRAILEGIPLQAWRRAVASAISKP
jgi:enterobacterial common antigen flippase